MFRRRSGGGDSTRRDRAARSPLALGSGLALLIATSAFGAAVTSDLWWAAGDKRTVPAVLEYPNETGIVRTLNGAGPMAAKDNPFFQALGTNGRACVTCHQPQDGMSLSVNTIRERWKVTGGKDPLFAAVDGSNCPSLPQGVEANHSLLLNYGLFRIPRSWPPKNADGKVIEPDFAIRVVRDPTGCNSGPVYGPDGSRSEISVYRRPRPVTNLKYLEVMAFFRDPKSGMPWPIDLVSGKATNGNLMGDGRVRTFRAQAEEALVAHMEIAKQLKPAQIDRLLTFTRDLYTAQIYDKQAGWLNTGGARGGPETLRDSEPGELAVTGANAGGLKRSEHNAGGIWSEYLAWNNPDNGGATPEQRAFRQSVARGARLFRTKTFLISDSSGMNSGPGFGNPVRHACAFCHNMAQMGNDVAAGQIDLGTTNEQFANPMPDLPLFEITCKKKPHPHLGRVFFTYDPGFALTSGKCQDVGKITLQSLRGLTSRAPYFSNGSARNLKEVMEFYERRYKLNLTEQETQDIINLMSVL